MKNKMQETGNRSQETEYLARRFLNLRASTEDFTTGNLETEGRNQCKMHYNSPGNKDNRTNISCQNPKIISLVCLITVFLVNFCILEISAKDNSKKKPGAKEYELIIDDFQGRKIEVTTKDSWEKKESVVQRNFKSERISSGTRNITYEEQTVKLDDDGLTERKRKFKTAKESSTRKKVTTKRTLDYKGKTVVFKTSEGKTKISCKNFLDEDTKSKLLNDYLENTKELLLPDNNVKVGENWKIDTEKFIKVLRMDLGSILLIEDEEEKKLSNSKCSGTLKSARRSTVTIEISFKCDIDFPSDDISGSGKITYKSILKFNLKKSYISEEIVKINVKQTEKSSTFDFVTTVEFKRKITTKMKR